MTSLEKRGSVYIITLTGPTSEHRLNPNLLSSLISSLTQIKPTAAALIIAGEGKFFSNGADLDWARQDSLFESRGAHLSSLFQQTIGLLLSLPFPTIAAVTGHAAGTGMVLALSCDYVVMRADRAVLYLPELETGLVLLDYLIEVIRSKVGNKAMKDMVLGGQKIIAAKGVEMGIIDKAVVGDTETLEEAVKLGTSFAGKNWNGKVYAKNRMAMLSEVCRLVGAVPLPLQSKL